MGSSTGAVKQFRQVFHQLEIMEQSTWVRFEEEEEVAVETSRGFQDEEHLDVLLPLLFALLHRVDVDGEANGRLHSSSGRGAVLGAPERQVRGAAGPARHL